MTKKDLTKLWDEKFDHIYLQHYPVYTERFDYIINELNRVGIYNCKNFSIYYSIPNQAEEIIYNYYKDNNLLASDNININMFRQGYTHYRILNEAKMFNYERILIIHDDIRFLKDLELIYKIISGIPDEYDICLFDYINCLLDTIDDSIDTPINKYCTKVNDSYYDGIQLLLLANTLCAYSKQYIDILIKVFNYKFGVPDSYISAISNDFDTMIELGIDIYNYKIIFCHPRLAIQYQYKSSLVKELFKCDFDNYDQYQAHPIRFLNKNIDYSMYNV